MIVLNHFVYDLIYPTYSCTLYDSFCCVELCDLDVSNFDCYSLHGTHLCQVCYVLFCRSLFETLIDCCFVERNTSVCYEHELSVFIHNSSSLVSFVDCIYVLVSTILNPSTEIEGWLI